MSDVDKSGGSGQPERSAVGIRRRNRQTRTWVLVSDRLAAWGISIGGLTVIVAVVGIMVFLINVAVPLTGDGQLKAQAGYQLQPAMDPIWVMADEYRTLGTRIGADGRYQVFHLPTGAPVANGQLDFGGQTATAAGGVVTRDQVAFGFDDGSVRFARLRFDVQVLLPDDLPGGLRALDERNRMAGAAVYTRIAGGQVRRVAFEAETDAPQTVTDSPIAAIAYRVGGTAERPTRSFVTFDSQGVGRLSRAESQLNMMTGQMTTELATSTLPALPTGTRILNVAMTSLADTVYAASESGELFRFDTRDFNAPTLSERIFAFDDRSAIKAMALLVGEAALVAGSETGKLKVFFKLRPETGAAPDGFKLVHARTHAPHDSAVVDIAVSERSKAFATKDADGDVWVRHSTSDQVMLRFEGTAVAGMNSTLVLLPRVDGVLRVADSGDSDFWAFDYPHPETTLKTIFGKVWYEGYEEPSYTWQSSSGSDVFEPKFSLVPLIFGTVKAAVYSLLFAIPIALLGAIYTSEFVHRRVRATVKPVMETMESLPTVVMGFIGALILAPIVESWISAVMLAFIALPLGLMLAAYLWQTLPLTLALKFDGLPKFGFMFAVIGVSLYLAYLLGPAFERAFFYGDFKGWTNSDLGTGTPFMFLVLLPAAFFAAGWGLRRSIGDAVLNYQRGLTRSAAGQVDLLRWLALAVVAVGLAYGAASGLTAIGFDPRGGVVDTYVQRNALVVGFVMGFAVIPNIYTLAEDALNSVPSHVRSASLATGATPWQTAKWVILPTAMSGVFAACMIGMGRAVGETMIVLMAAGNTPVLDWNIFNGLRTLSANIAVELPEAPQGGSLYRMLFLAALTLFAMTFAINTVAEVIRQRFRRRAFQL